MNKVINIGNERFNINTFFKDFDQQSHKETFENEVEEIVVNKKISEILYNYQLVHMKRIINILRSKDIVLDGSDTGTGKTFIAIALCKQLNLTPFIICPKSIISNWKSVIKLFNLDNSIVVNYETLKLGKYYNKIGERIKCPYIQVFDKCISTGDKKNYEWNLNENHLLIFDEVHQCRNVHALNTKILLSSKKTKCKKLLLSATLADSIKNFGIFGYLFKFYNSIGKVDKWINSLESLNIYHEIHKKIYPFNGSRMKISELGDQFQKNQISIDNYDMDESTFIQNEYDEINNAIKNIKKNEKSGALAKIMESRQKIEIYKSSTIIELTNEYIENNHSVVIFVNFNKTLEILKKKLKTDCVIHGNQTEKTRLSNLKNFMDNKEKIIICNIKAGGTGINLDDKVGNNPRVSLISPTWSSTDFKQCLGRIHRVDTKSYCLQRIICCNNTIEEKMCNNIKLKLDNIDSINDGDLLN
jgi:superfamily II DNA or RNA helicase